jgi:hypothetical protein
MKTDKLEHSKLGVELRLIDQYGFIFVPCGRHLGRIFSKNNFISGSLFKK